MYTIREEEPASAASEKRKPRRCATCWGCCRRAARSMYLFACCLCQCFACRWRQVCQDCGDGYIGDLTRHASERFFYMMDRLFAKQRSQTLLMVLLGCFQAGIGGTLYMGVWRYSDWVDDPRQEDEVYPLGEGVWHAWTFMADGGTQAPLWLPGQRLVAALISIGGIVFFASVLGLTVDLIRERMDNLRKGKSKIVEEHPTLLLGWTPLTVHIIEELCFANESEEGGVVAVLALESKEQMESELDAAIPKHKRRGTRIVIRSGSPLLMSDLVRVSAHRSKAIVIVGEKHSGANEADANTMRTVLSLKTLFGDQMQGHIVADLRDIDNEPLLRTVSDDSVEILVSHDMIGRLMLMSVRQPGLAKVYESLLGYEGDEFYIKEWPELVGRKFGELQLSFPDAVPIGVYAADDTCLLKPDAERVMQAGDELVVIAEDKLSYSPEDPHQGDSGVDPPPRPEIVIGEERVLICGWRRDIRDILKQLDKIVGYNTEVHIMTHLVPIAQREQALREDGFDTSELQNIVLVHWYGNTSVRRQLNQLPIETYTSCMIFAEQAFEGDTMYADSHSLATLILLRDLQEGRLGSTRDNKTSYSTRGPSRLTHSTLGSGSAVERLSESLKSANVIENCPVVCEILAPQTQQTIVHSSELGRFSDFCQTNKLVAQVMAMVSEERAVRDLLDELLGRAGTRLAVVPSDRYVWNNEKLCFFEVSQRASRFGEVLLGYHMRDEQRSVLNPPNKDKPFSWDHVDFAILQGKEAEEEFMAMIERSSAITRSTGIKMARQRAGGDSASPAAPTPGPAALLATSFSQLASAVHVDEQNMNPSGVPSGLGSNVQSMSSATWAAALSTFSTLEVARMQSDLQALKDALRLADAQDAYEPTVEEQTAAAI